MSTLKQFLYESYHTPRRFIANIIDEPAIVLLYHRVTQLESDQQQLCVSPDHFYEQIKFLKCNYLVLTSEEFVDTITRKKKFAHGSILITFDDGYADNFYCALPALESLQANAIFYITTGLLDTEQEFWWDSLERAFYESAQLPAFFKFSLNGCSIELSFRSQQERELAYYELHHFLKYSSSTIRTEIIQHLFQWASLPLSGRPSYRILNSSEVQALAMSSAATVGAHTHSHIPLKVLTGAQQRQDIQQSKDILENILGRPVTHFSYPYGLKKDYNKISIALCKELGFSMVCSNYYDQVHSWTDPFQIPRMLIRNWSVDIFKEKMKQFFRA